MFEIGVLHTAMLAVCLAGGYVATAQETPLPPDSTYRVTRNSVMIPTTVVTKVGPLYGLSSSDFEVRDNGERKPVYLIDSSDPPRLSVVLVVQCSGAAAASWELLRNLSASFQSFVGAAAHDVAVVRYGEEPELVQNFTESDEKVDRAIGSLAPCEGDTVATMDAVDYALSLFRKQDRSSRHIILLLSETRDHGSLISGAELAQRLAETDTLVDALSYSPLKREMVHDLKYGGGPGQVGIVSGPVGFLLEVAVGLKKNVSKELATLSGGEYFLADSRKAFSRDLLTMTNRAHNMYLLNIDVGQGESPGGHTLTVKVPKYPDAAIQARRGYTNSDGDVQVVPASP